MTSQYRVLVIDDDADVAEYCRTVLQKRGGFEVVTLSEPLRARSVVQSFEPDVVLTDIEMPGIDGLALISVLRDVRPGLRVVVMTAHISVQYAVAALRNQADEFLTKPVASEELVEVVQRMAVEARSTVQRTPAVVLAIGAHPDDVEIGVGGILAAHRAGGDSIVILTLSRGSVGGRPESRQEESLASAELLGARLFLEDLVDTEISNTGATVSIIERVVAEIGPTIVYTHSHHDRHQDHRAVHDAAMVATRGVPTVGCYQSPSSTVDFHPNRFVKIDGFTETKLSALHCFESQIHVRSYLEPDFVLATARYWSRFGGGTSAEPLEIIRDSVEVASSPTADSPAAGIAPTQQNEG
ncbi:MAG TPA: response regulator [Lacisediminihabitans sp.]|uniref:response regulator n=1 Tax=Lacisediminihabitans sp. TaxID=2787631 RepID=UPI002ED8E37A